MKKAIVIISSILGGAVLALAAVFLIIKFGGFLKANTPLNIDSEPPAVSQPVNVPNVETTPIESLTFTTPKNESFTTEDETLTFNGSVEGNKTLLLNGEEIICDKTGAFSHTVKLEYGKNTFKFQVGSVTKNFTVNRRYVVISSYTPKTVQTLSAGAQLNLSVTARSGAAVTAKFNGSTITLKEQTQNPNGFSTFTAYATLPKGHFVDKNLGIITFKATHNGFSESFTSEKIVCKREDIVVDFDPNATPSGGNYINVGSGIICEVVANDAETFTGSTKNDKSKPYNNYLPKGTVDYSSANLVTVKTDGYNHQLVTLRCGRKVYVSKRRSPYTDFTTVTKQYVGTLPDHNELSVADFSSDGTHTKLVLNTNWKAPFEFELKDQAYNSNFTVDNVTFNYVDITFCYATVFDGEIDLGENHPIFKEVKVIKNKSDYTLRFILKKQGGFYGWNAYYNNENQLCFEFLNPVQVTKADNEYGADLTGARILIDIGHGGTKDTGAGGLGNKQNIEKNRNLILGNKLKAELEALGATVYMTRTTDVEQLSDYKMNLLKQLKPDYCIAIHHDGNSNASMSGFGSYYFQPYSKAAAQFVQNHNSNLSIDGEKLYKSTTLKFHYYFMGRVSVCPVVLTENGFMSNRYDFDNIINDDINTQKAKAITKGIVEYFLSIKE